MLSCSKMMLRLLFGTICFALCSTEMSGSLTAIFKPSVMYTSPNSAVIRLEKLRPDQEKDGYVIEYGINWHNSKTLQVSKSSTAAMISNLEPDSLYNIRVLVPDVSNGGTHPGPSVSFRTSPVVAARIGVPQNVSVAPLPLYKLLVTWDLPYSALASDVVHYSLVFAPLYSPYLRKTSLLLPGHYKSFTLTYLRPNTLYKLKIAALLKSRKGPYSSWVIAQTVGQVRLDTDARQPSTKKPYHRLTENPGIIMTSSSTDSTTRTRPGQLSTKRVLEQEIQTTPYRTKEQSSMRPITKTTQVKESTVTKTTETSGYRTEMIEHSTQSSTQAKGDKMLVATGQNAESTTLPITVPSAVTLQRTTTSVPTEQESDGTKQQTTRQSTTTSVPTEQEINETTRQSTTTSVPTEQEIDETTLQSTATSVPTEQESDVTTQQTTQETTAPTLQSTTTTANQAATATTSSPSPSQHTEQVAETTTHQKPQLTTEGTKPQTTAPPTPRKTTRKHKTLPTVTTILQTTEDTKLSTEQTIKRILTKPKTERQTTRQPPKQTTKQVTDRMTQETLPQQTTQSNAKQTTQKPTSSHLQTNRVVSGTINILQPTTSSVSAVTDKHMTDSQLFASTPSPSQRNIIITPSSSTMPNLVITGTLPTNTTQDTCERLKPSMCSDIGYQTTKMTSKEGQFQMMDHVRSMWSHLTPLCRSHGKLKQFLCAASFPYCSQDLGGPFLPCRSMCMSTKKSCNMKGEEWPAEFDCSKFPDVGESAICISYGQESASSTTATIQVTQWSPVTPSNDPASQFTISTLATESSSLATRIPTTVEPKPLPSHCEPLYLKACDNVGYKAVQFPNYFNQTHQNDAGVKISRYWPLIEVKCSPLLRLFLCSLYTPICTTTITRNVLPCRSLCQQVTNDCSYFMKVYDGFEWPEGLTCEDFPDVNDGTCLSQKYLTSQGNENVLPTSPTTSREAQVTIHRSSTKTTLLTLPGAISVEQELPTTESSPSAAKPTSIPKESAKSTQPTQPKTGKNMKVDKIDNEQVEDSTEAITQRNEEDFMSSVTPMTDASINVVNDQYPSTKSSAISSPTSPITISPPSGCESLYLKICQGVGYDFTQFPNFFNHKHQNDAGRQVHRYWPLVEKTCSPKIQLFLCSLYVPMCTKTLSRAREMTSSLTHNMLPCRSLCYQVKRECRTKMKLYGLQWPEGVECTKFPIDGEKTCLYGKTNDTDSKGLFKITKAKKDSPKTPSTVLPSNSNNGTTKCQPLPPDHPCKNHYQMAAVSKASESFESTKKFIENHTSKLKTLATKKCLRNLEMFLCSVNTPRCSNGTMFGPCRSQCKTTLRRCGTELLEKINFQIVNLKDCRRFPVTRCTENKRKSKPTSKSVESF